MSEVQVVNVSALSGIGTDARIHGLAWGQYFQGLEPDVDNVPDSSSKDWNEMLFSFAAEVLESIPDQSSLERLWETTFRLLACFTLPKNIKPETVHLYSGAIASMDAEKVISIRDVVGSEVCIASDIGQSVYLATKAAISQGKKICLSFENIIIISSAFLNSSIGQLYNGEFSDEDIEERLRIINMSPDHLFLLERIKQRAKEYYKDPERFERATRMAS